MAAGGFGTNHPRSDNASSWMMAGYKGHSALIFHWSSLLVKGGSF